MSINSICVRRGPLGECTIRLGYTSFLTAIAFKRVGSAWGPTSDIKVEVMSLNLKGVAREENCWQIEGLTMSINSPCVSYGRLGECTIRLGYMHFLTTIAFRKVGSIWGPTNGIRVDATSSNPRGVTKGKIVGKSEGWVGAWVNAL